MKLSCRLETVIAAVNKTECAADIGTDHGFVPIELLRRGIVRRAIAADLREGPLKRAGEHVREAGLSGRISLRLADGLKCLAPGEAQTVIISGLGGGLMADILDGGRYLWDTVGQWVLSPQSEIPAFREWLLNNGFYPVREYMAHEDGKFYFVLDTRRGKEAAPLNEEAKDQAKEGDGHKPVGRAGPDGYDPYYGNYLIRTRDPIFRAYLEYEENMLTGLKGRLEENAAGSPGAAAKLCDVLARLRHNLEVQREMESPQDLMQRGTGQWLDEAHLGV